MSPMLQLRRVLTDEGGHATPPAPPALCPRSICHLVGAMPAAAQAGQRSATVTYVSPTRVKAGQALVLRGPAFSARRVSNTIIFRGAAGRVLLVKPLNSACAG